MAPPLLPFIALTPKDEVDAYASIQVPLPDRTHTVKVVKYRCDNKKFGKDADHGGTQKAIVFKDRVLGAVGTKTIFAAMSASRFVGVFLGKGSRKDIIQVLKWVDDKDLYDAKALKVSKQYALQKIVDDYIGLDCNGFVGNWLNDNGVAHVTPSTPPSGIGGTFARQKRTRLEDILPYDVFYWHDHVASVHAIGPVTTKAGSPPERTATVCEAYGAIMCKDRVIRAGRRPGTFQVAGHDWADAEACGTGLLPPVPLAMQHAIEAVVGAFQ